MPAAVVDHVLAIRAGGAPYPALDQLRSMCELCHNRKTRHVEQLGKAEAPKVWGSTNSAIRAIPRIRGMLAARACPQAPLGSPHSALAV